MINVIFYAGLIILLSYLLGLNVEGFINGSVVVGVFKTVLNIILIAMLSVVLYKEYKD